MQRPFHDHVVAREEPGRRLGQNGQQHDENQDTAEGVMAEEQWRPPSQQQARVAPHRATARGKNDAKRDVLDPTTPHINRKQQQGQDRIAVDAVPIEGRIVAVGAGQVGRDDQGPRRPQWEQPGRPHPRP